MRLVVPLIVLLLATGAGSPPPVIVPMPAPELSPGPIRNPDGASPVCRDRIQEVRRELGKPALERHATPRDPMLIAAVDKRIDGCSVMVMRNDTSDFRPLPGPQEPRMMPAR